MLRWQLQTQHFLLPKSGHQLSECEDAIGINEAHRRFALADGATEAFDARSWAQRLVRDWVQSEQPLITPEEFRGWVADEGESLHDSWNRLRLSWYAEEKAGTGSFAAFVGLQLELDAGAPRWRAIAIGDSCLIHSRRNGILKALPLSRYESFTATPLLVPSLASLQDAAFDRVVVDCGTIENGDVLLLLSDAVAAWYLRLVENDDQAHSFMDHLLRENRNCELAQLFESERSMGRIKDDDIGIIRIEVQNRES